MSYMKHYGEYLKDKGLLHKPNNMKHVDKYHEEHPEMIPPPKPLADKESADD